MNSKRLKSFQNARGIVESESKRNSKIQIPKGIRPSEMLDVLHKSKWSNEKKTWDCNSGTKDAHINPLLCFINNHHDVFGHQRKSPKVRKSINNIKMYFKQFFTFLQRTPTFIISLLKAIYRSSSPGAFTKKRRSATGT